LPRRRRLQRRGFSGRRKSFKRKVREDSSSDSDCQSFESGTSDNDYEDEDTECLFCTGRFSDDQYGEKWVQCVRYYRWAHEDCGIEEDNFVCPNCVKLKCKWKTLYKKKMESYVLHFCLMFKIKVLK
jgi:hypothetical protein